jgi:diguanylate cyclase
VDWTKLPDLIAVGLLAWAFASVARQCRTFASKNWLAGWYFIVLHFVTLFFRPLPGLWGQIDAVASVLSLVLAAMLFMRAAVPLRAGLNFDIIPPLVASVFALFACAVTFHAPQWLIWASEAILVFVPLALTLSTPSWTSPLLRWSMTALHLGLGLAFWLIRNRADNAELALDATLCMLYLGCALHFWHHCRKATAGALIGITGFLLWASVFFIAPMMQSWFPSAALEEEIWNLPKYIVAVGMILLMLEEQIDHNKHLALHDELTGLPNRRLFQDRLAGALERARRAGTQTALLIVDLDDFKSVNDNYGHHAGDQLLQHVAAILSSRIRHSDTVARTGGDEFAVILEPPTSHTEAMIVCRALLDLLHAPMQLNEHTLNVGASVGVAVFPDDGKDMKSLCIHADMRMYEGKRGELFGSGKTVSRVPPEHSPAASAAEA